MEWDALTAKDFPEAVKKSKGLCVLPMGCIEKHGDHLPLGTDSIISYELACAAAKIEPAVVFPYNCFGSITEGRHQPGTIALKYDFMLQLVESVCDEIARNGFKKIFILNFHGGNQTLLSFLSVQLLEKERPFTLYYSNAWTPWAQQLDGFKGISKAKADGHGGEMETSLLMHLRPETVKADRASEDGGSQGRLKKLADCGIRTGADWYANYPNHLHCDKTPGSKAKGGRLFKLFVESTARQLKEVKADKAAPAIFKEFRKRAASHGDGGKGKL